MSGTLRKLVKDFQRRVDPKIKPFRAAVQFSKRIDDEPTYENTYYGENLPARNMRYMERVRRGLIDMAEYERLAAEPITGGLEKIPLCDFPLIDV